MSIYSQLRNSLYDSLDLIVSEYYPNTPIIFSHQDGDEPAVTYIDLQELFVEQQGRVQTSTRTSQVVDPVTGEIKNMLNTQAHYEVEYQLGFTGSKAGDIAYDLHHLINTTPVWEKFQLHSLYPIRKTEVRRSPLLRETQWIERFLFDVTFTYSVSTDQEVDVIEFISFAIEGWRVNEGLDWFIETYGEDFLEQFGAQLQSIVNEQYPEMWRVYEWFSNKFGSEWLDKNQWKVDEAVALFYPDTDQE